MRCESGWLVEGTDGAMGRSSRKTRMALRAEVETEADHRVESFVLVLSWRSLKTKLTTQGRASNITRVGAVQTQAQVPQ
jgi:hypothetical protein